MITALALIFCGYGELRKYREGKTCGNHIVASTWMSWSWFRISTLVENDLATLTQSSEMSGESDSSHASVQSSSVDELLGSPGTLY
jgi:hypothetical protein